MSRAQTTAYRLRWVLLLVALLCWLMGAFYLINIAWPQWKIIPLGPDDADRTGGYGLQGVLGCLVDSDGAYWCLVGLYLGLFLLTQWFFLFPRGKLRLTVAGTGRPMALAVAVAALMAAMLSVGLLATILHLAGKWESFAKLLDWDGMHGGHIAIAPLSALVVAWGMWIVIFVIYSLQRDHFTWVGKILRGLIGGSILELLIAGPAQAMAGGDGKDCRCVRGSYTGLVLGGTVLFWCFGPGIALLFLREKQRRQQIARDVCLGCGYDLRASKDRCPECGLPIPPGAGENPPTKSP